MTARLGANSARATIDQPIEPASHAAASRPCRRPTTIATAPRPTGDGDGDEREHQPIGEQARDRPGDGPQPDDPDPCEHAARGAAAATRDVVEDRARLREVVLELVREQGEVPRGDDREAAHAGADRRPEALAPAPPPADVDQPRDDERRDDHDAEDVALHDDHRADGGQQPPARMPAAHGVQRRGKRDRRGERDQVRVPDEGRGLDAGGRHGHEQRRGEAGPWAPDQPRRATTWPRPRRARTARSRPSPRRDPTRTGRRRGRAGSSRRRRGGTCRWRCAGRGAGPRRGRRAPGARACRCPGRRPTLPAGRARAAAGSRRGPGWRPGSPARARRGRAGSAQPGGRLDPGRRRLQRGTHARPLAASSSGSGGALRPFALSVSNASGGRVGSGRPATRSRARPMLTRS